MGLADASQARCPRAGGRRLGEAGMDAMDTIDRMGGRDAPRRLLGIPLVRST